MTGYAPADLVVGIKWCRSGLDHLLLDTCADRPKTDVSVWYQYLHKLLGKKHLDWGSNEMSLEMVRSVEIVELVANRLEKLCAAVEVALMEIGQRAVSSTPSEDE